MNPSETCPVCGSGRAFIVCDEIRPGVSCNVYRCDDCTLIFLPSAYFEEARNPRQYQGEYRYTPTLDKLIGTPHNPYRKRVARISANLDPEKTEMLEIGCGEGYFLHAVRRQVKSIVGQELNHAQAEFCRKRFGIQMFTEPIESLEINHRFDVVCMFGVLEHVPNPKTFIRRAMSFVKAGGILFLDVPNTMCPLLSLYHVEGYDKFYYRGTHLLNFNPESLGTLLRRAGFYVHDIELVQNYSLSNHLHWLATGKPQDSLNVGYRFQLPGKLRADARHMADKIDAFFQNFDRAYREFLIRNGYSDMISCIVHNSRNESSQQ